MTSILERDSFDARPIEYRRIAVVMVAVLLAAAAWHGARGRLLYPAARSSVGCPGREKLLAAALRHADPSFPDEPQLWNYNLARPEWIAWSSVRETIPLGDGSWLPKWQVKVADRDLALKGVIAGDRLAAPPADADGDGSCEVLKEFYPDLDGPQKDLRWWAVVRLGEKENEIVWAGMIDTSVWRSRQARLKPIWRDMDGDGSDELVFITVETMRTPDGGIVFKPPRTIAVFEWTSPGGTLRSRLLPDDCGIRPWKPQGVTPVRVGQASELDPLVRELLPASKVP